METTGGTCKYVFAFNQKFLWYQEYFQGGDGEGQEQQQEQQVKAEIHSHSHYYLVQVKFGDDDGDVGDVGDVGDDDN